MLLGGIFWTESNYPVFMSTHMLVHLMISAWLKYCSAFFSRIKCLWTPSLIPFGRSYFRILFLSQPLLWDHILELFDECMREMVKEREGRWNVNWVIGISKDLSVLCLTSCLVCPHDCWISAWNGVFRDYLLVITDVGEKC